MDRRHEVDPRLGVTALVGPLEPVGGVSVVGDVRPLVLEVVVLEHPRLPHDAAADRSDGGVGEVDAHLLEVLQRLGVPALVDELQPLLGAAELRAGDAQGVLPRELLAAGALEPRGRHAGQENRNEEEDDQKDQGVGGRERARTLVDQRQASVHQALRRARTASMMSTSILVPYRAVHS